MKRLGRKYDKTLGYLLIIPVVILIFIIIGIPFINALYLSFTNKVAGSDPKLIGFKNYISLIKDPDYLMVLRNTFVYTFVCIAAKLVIGLFLAVVLNQKFFGRSVIRTLLLLPWAVSGMVAAMSWKWMYNDTYGIINSLLMQAHIIKEPVLWLSDPKLALLSCIIVNVWRGVPFFFFSILGGLQTIDSQMYEAADIDGAGTLRKFFSVTVPSLKPVIIITSVLSTIWTFNDFENVYLITGGGPIHASSIISTYTYEIAFLQNEMGKAMSVAGSVIPIILLMIIIPMKMMNKEEN